MREIWGKNRLLVYLEQTELDAGMSMRLNRLQAIFKYTYNNQEDFYKKLFQAQGISLFREMSKNIVDEEESLPVSDYSPLEVVQLRRNLDFGDQKAYKQTCKHVIEKIVETINTYIEEIRIGLDCLGTTDLTASSW